MNDQKKLALSKETLRCLDDQDLTDVAGGWNRGGNSHDCNNSHDCGNSNAAVCISEGNCNSFVCSLAFIC